MVSLLEKKSSIKFLAIIIIENLSWKDHVKYITSPIARNVGILCKLKHYLPLDILIMLYNTLVLPYISYCNIIWANSMYTNDTILKLQKKAIRICANAGYYDHTDPLFSLLRL